MFRLEMGDSEIAPLRLKVLQHEAPVAMLGRGLATQQHRRNIEQSRADAVFDMALLHQRKESLRILLPTAFLLFVLVEHLLSRREQRLVDILRAAELA